MSTRYVREMLRMRPAKELLSKIHKTVKDPVVVDVGCGDGHAITHLRQHWPTAKIVCLDKDKNVLRETMSNCIDSNVAFAHSSIEDWKPTERPDVIYANSVLHLIEGHSELMEKMVDMLPKGGILAVQMPCIEDELFVRILKDCVKQLGCTEMPYKMEVHSPSRYYQLLSQGSAMFETWSSTHHHYLPPEDVINLLKTSGTGGTIWNAYLSVLGKSSEPELADLFTAKVKEAYPVIPNTNECLFSIPRFFMVMTKEGHGPIMGMRHV